MNFQAYIEDTYRIVKEEPIILILGGLIVQLLTVFSLGILAGPFMGGYTFLVILYLRDKKKPSFNDIFSGLQQFTHLFPYFLVLLLIFIGFMLLILPGLLFATWWIYVLPLMVDRKMSFSNAMRLSMNKVNEKGFLMHLVFVLLISIIPIMLIDLISTIIPFLFLLKILLPPLQVGCLASLYIDQFKLEETTAGPAANDDSKAEITLLSSPKGDEELAAGEDEENRKAESGTAEMTTNEENTPNDSGENGQNEDKTEITS
jgi:hypothetical protein